MYCTVPSLCTGDTCATPILTLERYVGGNRLTTPLLSEGYCLSVNGHCVGVTECEGCQCNPSLVFQYQSESCVNISQGIVSIYSTSVYCNVYIGCLYKFNGSSSLYISSNGYLSSVMNDSSTVIINTLTDSVISNECTVHTVQIDTYNGWRNIPSTTLQLKATGNIKVHTYTL